MSWYLLALAAAGVALLLAAVLEVGAPAPSTRTSREVVSAERGVVQSTVSGTGNLTPSVDVEANFRTSGTLSSVYVHVGEHVHAGQLLATLDTTAAQLAVDQAQENLDAAQDQLAAAQSGTSTSNSSGSSSTSGGGSSANASTTVSASARFVDDRIGLGTRTSAVPAPTRSSTTTPSRTTTSQTQTTTSSSSPTRSGSPGTKTSTSATKSTAGASTNQTTTASAPSPAAIASARASVDGAQESLRNAQTTLAETRLTAPSAGTIVSLESLSPGDPVSGGTGSSGTAGSTGSTSSSGAGSSSAASGSSSSGSLGTTTSSSGSSSTGSGFAEIVDTGHMTMTVALSEADISKVRVGQTATVTLDALSGVALAAHVASISTLATTSSSVVSYNAVLDLDDSRPQVKAGMSASASIIVHQVSGVTLPNAAVSGSGSVSTVNVLRNGRTVATPVVVGLQGDSRTQIVSGLSPGAQVVVRTTLPALGASSSSATGGTSGTLGSGRSRFGGAGGFGGGAAFGGGTGGFGGGRLAGGGG